MALTEAQRQYQREWHRAAYQRDPGKFRSRARARRKLQGAEINAKRRRRAAIKRDQALQLKAARHLTKLDRQPRTLGEWFRTQAQFSDWAQVARALGVTRQTLRQWRIGKFEPATARRRAVFELTGLARYADAATWVPRPERCRTTGERADVPLLVDLVVQCGFAARELKQLRVSDVDEKLGIRSPSGHVFPYGDGWEQIRSSSVADWMARANPTDLLFFSRKPVNRSRPANALWIARALHASGVTGHERRSARARHLTGDLARFGGGTGAKFLAHLARVHGFSRTGALSALENLRRRRDKLELGALKGLEPEAAYDLLYPPKARPGRRRANETTEILRKIRAAVSDGITSDWKIGAQVFPPDPKLRGADKQAHQRRAAGRVGWFRKRYPIER